MKKQNKAHAIPASLALLASAASSHGAVIFTDTFDSGTGAWYRATNTGELLNSNSKLQWSEGVGNSSNMGEAIGRTFTSQSLSVGQTILLSFEFSWTTAGNTNILRAGLFDTTNPITAGNWSGSNAIGAWNGYYTFVRDSSASANVARESTSTVASATAGPTSGGTETAITSAAGATSYDIVNGTTYQCTFEVTRTSSSQVTTLFTLKDGTTTRFSVSGVDSTSPYTSFDTVVFKTGADNPVSVFDNIQLSVIPEPGSAALGAIGVLALLRRRRI